MRQCNHNNRMIYKLCVIVFTVSPRLTRTGEAHPRTIRVELSPRLTATSLLIEALGVSRGSPPAWFTPIRAALDQHHLDALRSPFDPQGTRCMPDCLAPVPTSGGSIDDEFDVVAQTDPSVFVEQLEADGLAASGWQVAARCPRRWLGIYTSALRCSWIAVRPLWHSLLEEIDAERQRMQCAIDTRSADVAIAALNLQPGRHSAPRTLGDDLVLAPVLGGRRATLIQTRQTSHGYETGYLAYPLPTSHWCAQRATRRPNHQPGSGLEALLGAQRARLLASIDGAATAGALAATMMVAPSAITYHLDTLERAGLVERERDGRQVVAHRTTRAEALLDLYAEPRTRLDRRSAS
jgi:DNA-binding transcriptional ArsR family regulator